jgi:hypothetical protein
MTPDRSQPKAKRAAPAKQAKRPATKKSKAPAAASKRATGAATKARPAAVKNRQSEPAATRRVDERVRKLADWRGATLAEARRIILKAAPGIVEEIKWVKPSNPSGVPVWSQEGIVCTGETYKAVVKLTFAQGAKLADPTALFNASLEGGTRRAIDIREGEKLNAAALAALVKEAVNYNRSRSKPAKAGAKPKPVKLLSGGNPQIAKADGDAPVQAYIDALSGWKRDVCQRLDAIIARHAPQARKAVKWNSPFYGMEGRGWFMSFHVFTRYVKVAFFRGASLRPVPPGLSQGENTRYLDIHEKDVLDEARMASWVKQAAALPGWTA